MKKRLLSTLLCLCMVMSLLPAMSIAASAAWSADTAWYTGNGPYTITTADQLAGLASLVNGGTDTFSGKTIYLGANINLEN